MALPTVFIGSSSEQLQTAHALCALLTPFSTPTVWDQAPFTLNETAFDSLLKAAQVSDYAVFIFEPDDVTHTRHVNRRAIRDNVLFEFGLFVGRMGRGRTFWISSGQSDGDLPTDLVGLTHLRSSRNEPTLSEALRPAAEQLRTVVESQGRRTDREIDELDLDSIHILCAASAEYDEPQFADDLQQIQHSFPERTITAAHGVDGRELLQYFAQPWDIVHLAMYVDPVTGDLIVPSRGDPTRAVISADGVEQLLQMSTAIPRLVVVVTCDSLALAVRLAPRTSVIAGHKPIDVKSALRWSSIFYPALASGCPLSEAFNRAQKLADPGLVLLSKRDFQLLPSLPNLTKDGRCNTPSSGTRG